MAKTDAIERVQSRISKLILERKLLNNRLVILERENRPESRSREQENRAIQIQECRKRLTQIEGELKIVKYQLERIKSGNLEDINQGVKDLSLEQEPNPTNTSSNQSNMSQNENTANASASSTTTTGQNTIQIATMAATSQEAGAHGIDRNAQLTSQAQNILESSTPKTVFTATKPIISPSKFEFPPSNEPQSDRMLRLEKERQIKENLDKILSERYDKPQAQIKTGTIPKTRRSDIDNIPTDEIYLQNYENNARYYEQNRKPTNEQVGLDETWMGQPSRFLNYKPTPQRAHKITEQFQENRFNNFDIPTINYGEEAPNTRGNRVTFDLPHEAQMIRNQYTEPLGQQYNTNSVRNAQQFPQNNLNNNAQQNQTNQQYDQGQNRTNPRNSFLKRLKLIPKFSGESHKELKEFIDTAETLYYSCMNDAEEQEFYEQMTLQLHGEARTVVKNMQDLDWETIKDKFTRYFSFLSNKEIIQSKLENLHQEKDESLSSYTDRVWKLLRERNSLYNNLTEEQRKEHDRIARRAFSKGIRDIPLRKKMLNRGASSFEDAVSFAIEAENDSLFEVPSREQYCRTCQISGHRESECRRKSESNSDIGKLVSALRMLGNRQTNNRPPFQQVQRNNNWNRNWQQNPNQGWRNITPTRNWNNNNWNNNGRNFNNGSNNNSNPSNNRNWQNQNQTQTQNRNWNNYNNFNRTPMNQNNNQGNGFNRNGQNNQRPRANFLQNSRLNMVNGEHVQTYNNNESEN